MQEGGIVDTAKENEQLESIKVYCPKCPIVPSLSTRDVERIRDLVIKEEHARLRALFEKKKAESLQHDLTGQDTEEETRLINIGRASGINDCLSELQDTKEERA